MTDPNKPTTPEEWRALQSQRLAGLPGVLGDGGATPPADGTPAPGATPAAGKKYLGKFDDEETAEKSYHLLIKNYGDVQGERDALKAEKERLESELLQARAAAPRPLSPGRADPSVSDVARTPSALEQKFTEHYGIDPADARALVREVLGQELEAREAPVRKWNAARETMAATYPQFPQMQQEVIAFLRTQPDMAQRVGDLWDKGEYLQSMELGWLLYDNARRVATAAAAAATEGAGQIAAERAAGSLPQSQAQGSHESAVRSPLPSQATPEERAAMAQAYRRGDPRAIQAVRDNIFGRALEGIPDFQ